MKAILLAAGKGKRMQPLTFTTPKPLLRVLGKPVLERTFEVLPDVIDEVVIIVGYMQKQIREHFGKRWEGRTVYYVEQTDNMGTGDAVKRARDLFEDGERFLVLNGDDLYVQSDLEKLLQHEWGILAVEVDDPSRFGVLVIDDEGHLTDIVEKPKEFVGNLINIGAYVMKTDYFDAELVPIGGGEYGLPQTLQKMVQDGKISLKVEKGSFWYPLGYPEDIAKAEEALREHQS